MLWPKESYKLSTKKLSWWDRTEKLSSENGILPGFNFIHSICTMHSLSTVSGALRLKHLRYTTIWWRVIADEMSELKVRIDFTLVKLEREALINFTLWSGESCEKPWDTGSIEVETKKLNEESETAFTLWQPQLKVHMKTRKTNCEQRTFAIAIW